MCPKSTEVPTSSQQTQEEVWAVIEGSKGKYEISTYGQVRSNHSGSPKILSQNTTKSGYWKISIRLGNYDTTHSTHRLIAKTFIPNPLNKPCINHKDGNKLNNYVDNLEWCTQKENIDHAISLGLLPAKKAKKKYVHKYVYKYKPKFKPYFRKPDELQAEDVMSIRRMLENGFDAPFITKMFGISSGVVFSIKNGDLPHYFFRFLGSPRPYPKLPEINVETFDFY